jgi:hypothetical protein
MKFIWHSSSLFFIPPGLIKPTAKRRLRNSQLRYLPLRLVTFVIVISCYLIASLTSAAASLIRTQHRRGLDVRLNSWITGPQPTLLYCIYYGSDGTSSSVSDVNSYVILRKFLDYIFNILTVFIS